MAVALLDLIETTEPADFAATLYEDDTDNTVTYGCIANVHRTNMRYLVKTLVISSRSCLVAHCCASASFCVRFSRSSFQLLIVYASLDHATCKRLLDQTCASQRDGGMLTKDGTRRRTMGGVFIELACEEMPPAAWSAVRRIIRQQTKGGAK